MNNVRVSLEHASNTVAAATVGITVLGISVQDWAAILAGVWIILQMGWWIYTKFKDKE